MEEQRHTAQPEWRELQAQAAMEKNGLHTANFLSLLERAARKEQEELKLKIRPQVEIYRRFVSKQRKNV
jgi:hypothetical protein